MNQHIQRILNNLHPAEKENLRNTCHITAEKDSEEEKKLPKGCENGKVNSLECYIQGLKNGQEMQFTFDTTKKIMDRAVAELCLNIDGNDDTKLKNNGCDKVEERFEQTTKSAEKHQMFD